MAFAPTLALQTCCGVSASRRERSEAILIFRIIILKTNPFWSVFSVSYLSLRWMLLLAVVSHKLWPNCGLIFMRIDARLIQPAAIALTPADARPAAVLGPGDNQ
jgi:hypothetical protein